MKFYSKLKIFYLAVTVTVLQVVSCTQLNTFEKNTPIPKNEWKNNFEVKGSFSITDAGALYSSYIVLRHTDAYKYNNIWLNLGTQPPGDTMHYQKIEVQLGTDATGWFGTGMNDIWEIRQAYFKGMQFKKPGIYNFSITQIMRDDPLPAVMSVGLRLEKQGSTEN